MSDPWTSRQLRLDHYEKRTALPMVILALAYIALYAFEVLDTNLTPEELHVLTLVSNAIWISFVVDLAIRTFLAPRRVAYLLAHPIDVIAVILPAFRAFRVLRVFTAGQWLLRDGTRLAYGRTGLATAAAVGMVVFLGALAALDAEKADPSSPITSLGSGLWFAFETITTVGYGDTVPVTVQGRVVAVMLMLIGISLIGIVSATLATTFLDRVRGQERQELAKVAAEEREHSRLLLEKLESLETQVSQLTVLLSRGPS